MQRHEQSEDHEPAKTGTGAGFSTARVTDVKKRSRTGVAVSAHDDEPRPATPDFFEDDFSRRGVTDNRPKLVWDLVGGQVLCGTP